MKRLGSTRAAALLGITGGAAVLAAILRWVQLSNDIKSNGAVLQGRYLYLVIAVLSVAVLAALAVLIRPLAPPDALGGDLFRRKAAEYPAHRLGRVLRDRRRHALLRIPAEDGGRSPRPHAAAEDNEPAHPAARRRVRGHACCLCTQVPAATRSPLRCCI